MKTEPYYVNVSSINDFASCRFRWWCKWIMNWVPLHDAPPLTFGRLLHQIFEDHSKGLEMKEAIGIHRGFWMLKAMESTDTYDRDLGLKAIKTLDDLSEALLLWKDQYQFQIPVLEVETPFEIPHPFDASTIIRGRPDRVGVMDDSIWHIQHKSVASSSNFGVFCDLARRSYHETIYLEALAKKYPQYKVGGTLFDLIRKLKYRTKVTKSRPEGERKRYEEMFFQYPMAIDLKSSLHEHVLQTMLNHTYEMRRVEKLWHEEGRIPSENPHMNGGFYGSAPDPYFRVLTGEIELGDKRFFKKRVDTYAANEEDGE